MLNKCNSTDTSFSRPVQAEVSFVSLLLAH